MPDTGAARRIARAINAFKQFKGKDGGFHIPNKNSLSLKIHGNIFLGPTGELYDIETGAILTEELLEQRPDAGEILEALVHALKIRLERSRTFHQKHLADTEAVDIDLDDI